MRDILSTNPEPQGYKIILPNLHIIFYNDEHILHDWGRVDNMIATVRRGFEFLYPDNPTFLAPPHPIESMYLYGKRGGTITHHIIAHVNLDNSLAMAANHAKEETSVLHQIDGIDRLERRLAALHVPLHLHKYASYDLLSPTQREFVADIGALTVLHEHGYDIMHINRAQVDDSQLPALLAYQSALTLHLPVN